MKYLQVVDVRVERLVRLFNGCSSLCRLHTKMQPPAHFLRNLNTNSRSMFSISCVLSLWLTGNLLVKFMFLTFLRTSSN